MKKRIALLAAALVTALLFTGCALRTVDQMYTPPKRSEEYDYLQSAIDMAMYSLEYCAPISGEYQQTVQMADLNGDGVEEYLVFAKGTSEKPLHILIFDRDAEGKAQIMEIIESNGTAFEQVEYVDMDDAPGCELVVGRQVSDRVQRSVSVYSFSDGDARQILSTGYSRFLTSDLDGNGQQELMVIQPGEGDTDNGAAFLYSYNQGQMERSVEVALSQKVDNIKRIMTSRLQDGNPAVYIASAVEEDAILTDILALREGRFTNISYSRESGTGVKTLRNYYVYGDDVDNDGILELPDLITMQPLYWDWDIEMQYLIRWYAVDSQGREADKMYTFHNYVGGWYIQLDSAWADRANVEQEDSVYCFYAWDEGHEQAQLLFRVYTFTGSDRESQAASDGRFALYHSEGAVYAASVEEGAEAFGITPETLINSFHLIHQDWKTGET